MNTYRLKIKPQSSFLTPWQADTIFGNLCWIIAWHEGEDVLKEFLQDYKNGNPAFILSDGMPGDFLPVPVHLSLAEQKSEGFEAYQKAKNLKKVAWLSPDIFESVRKGNLEIDYPEEIKTFRAFTTLHSSINRITGTTGEEGSLFELSEYTVEQNEISIYLKIRDGWEEKVSLFFKYLSLTGYGKKKSVGKGAFEIIRELEPFDKFNDFDGANAFMSLSNFVPAKSDPTDGFYKTLVKYGKLGGEFTFCGNPFKKPLMMLTTGSSFKVEKTIKPFYGRIVENIAPVKQDVVHYGYAFAVPIRIDI
jgi:CRISPR-associated protein Csm4